MDNDSNEERGQRDDDHSSGYEQHEVPATSQTAPTSHGDTGQFMRNHPPAFWWIMSGIGIFVIAGLFGAWLVVRSEGDTDPLGARGEASPAAVVLRTPAAAGGSAVAGVQAPVMVTILEGGVFDPKTFTVPNGGRVVFTASGDDCELVITPRYSAEGSTGQALGDGQTFTWTVDRAGTYDVACKGYESGAAFVTVP